MVAVSVHDVIGMIALPVSTTVLPRMSLMIGVSTWKVQVSVTVTGWPIVIEPLNTGPGTGVCWSQSMSAHSAAMRAR
jgi:hypothetical protein